MSAKNKSKAGANPDPLEPGPGKGSVLVIGNDLPTRLEAEPWSVEGVSSEAEALQAMQERTFNAVALMYSSSAPQFIETANSISPNTRVFLVPSRAGKEDSQSMLTDMRRLKEKVATLTLVSGEILPSAIANDLKSRAIPHKWEPAPACWPPVRPPEDRSSLKEGSEIGGAVLLKEIGNGSFGSIYYAVNKLVAGEPFAMKVLHYDAA